MRRNYVICCVHFIARHRSKPSKRKQVSVTLTVACARALFDLGSRAAVQLLSDSHERLKGIFCRAYDLLWQSPSRLHGGYLDIFHTLIHTFILHLACRPFSAQAP
ncbi:MAG: hypothetical protein ABSG17_15035 [Spirochaetia bacterium]